MGPGYGALLRNAMFEARLRGCLGHRADRGGYLYDTRAARRASFEVVPHGGCSNANRTSETRSACERPLTGPMCSACGPVMGGPSGVSCGQCNSRLHRNECQTPVKNDSESRPTENSDGATKRVSRNTSIEQQSLALRSSRTLWTRASIRRVERRRHNDRCWVAGLTHRCVSR